MINQIAIHIWRGEASKVAAIMGVLGVVIVLTASSANSRWLGWWAQTSMQPQLYGVIVYGSVMTAAAVWQAQRAVRRRTTAWEAVTPGGGLPALLVLWLAAAVPAMVGYLLVIIAALIRTATISATFEPVWSLLGLGAAGLLGQTALGTAVGTFFRPRVIAPLAGLGSYVVIVVQTFAGPRSVLVTLVPVVDERWDPEFTAREKPLVTAAAWFVLAGVLPLVLAARRRGLGAGPHSATVAGVSVATALALAAVVTIPRPADLSSPWARLRPQPASAACTGGTTPRVCFWPADAHLVPVAEQAIDRVATALHGLDATQISFAEVGLAGGYGTITLPLGTALPSTDELATLMLTAIVLPPGCDTLLMPLRGGTPQDLVLESILLSRAGYPTIEYSEEIGRTIRRFLALEAARQDAWLDQALGRHLACQPIPPIDAA